jgi:hypothetical protein
MGTSTDTENVGGFIISRADLYFVVINLVYLIFVITIINCTMFSRKRPIEGVEVEIDDSLLNEITPAEKIESTTVDLLPGQNDVPSMGLESSEIRTESEGTTGANLVGKTIGDIDEIGSKGSTPEESAAHVLDLPDSSPDLVVAGAAASEGTSELPSEQEGCSEPPLKTAALEEARGLPAVVTTDEATTRKQVELQIEEPEAF